MRSLRMAVSDMSKRDSKTTLSSSIGRPVLPRNAEFLRRDIATLTRLRSSLLVHPVCSAEEARQVDDLIEKLVERLVKILRKREAVAA
jgi:hypothetical protein